MVFEYPSAYQSTISQNSGTFTVWCPSNLKSLEILGFHDQIVHRFTVSELAAHQDFLVWCYDIISYQVVPFLYALDVEIIARCWFWCLELKISIIFKSLVHYTSSCQYSVCQFDKYFSGHVYIVEPCLSRSEQITQLVELIQIDIRYFLSKPSYPTRLSFILVHSKSSGSERGSSGL